MLRSGESITTQYTFHQFRWVLWQNAQMIPFLVGYAFRQFDLQVTCTAFTACVVKLSVLQYFRYMCIIRIRKRCYGEPTDKLYR
ncbi:hypothetical protein D3C76_1413650 [compost metagenome]